MKSIFIKLAFVNMILLLFPEAAISQVPSTFGGTAVRVIQDTSATNVTTATQSTKSAVANEFSANALAQLLHKEKVLDPNAWAMAKKLQQDLTAEYLKWLGGQQDAQSGQVPFVQNYSEHNSKVVEEIRGKYLFGDGEKDELAKVANQCNADDLFQVRAAVFKGFQREFGQDTASTTASGSNQCEDESTDKRHPFARMFANDAGCRDQACATLRARKTLHTRIVDAQINEARVIDTSKGFIPQRACVEVTDVDGNKRAKCGIVNPLTLAADAASFNVVQLPGLSLLAVKEMDEVVSNLMSNLTNQAVHNPYGVLGLSGNPDYPYNFFGDDGALSYVQALVLDDISKYQSGGTNLNIIAEALKAEKNYYDMQLGILADIKKVEDRLLVHAEECPAFSLQLSPFLQQAKASSTRDALISTSTIEALTGLNNDYLNPSSDSALKNAILTAFENLKKVLLEMDYIMRDAILNHSYNLTYLNLFFRNEFEEFKYIMAVTRWECDGDATDFADLATAPPG